MRRQLNHVRKLMMIRNKSTGLLLSLFVFQTLAVAQVAANETAPGITVLNKPFDQYTWVTAHNGYLDDMRTQLNRGVRGFMLDLHPGNLEGGNKVYLCHTSDTGKCDIRTQMEFSAALNNIFLPFLRSNSNAVVTLLLENRVSRENFAAAMAKVPELAKWVYEPAVGTTAWPTLEQMIRSGKRLVVLSDRQSGSYQVNGQKVSILQDSQWEMQNYWDLGTTALKHDWSCPSRWSKHEPKVAGAGFTSWNRLFVMNQFHSWGATSPHAGGMDNNLTYLERRVNQHCKNAIGYRKAPNYLAIDFNQAGDAFPYAAALSQGGFYFYEQNNANEKGDTTCVVPAGKNAEFSLPNRGCEADDIRSGKLRGIAKGTRLTVFDSPSGSGEDDRAYIDVKQDIDVNNDGVIIGSFEKNMENQYFKMTYVRNNGLDGKISRIKIEQNPPTDFSDSSVVFYFGNNGKDNIVCTIGLAKNMQGNFSGACNNDAARSAVILRAKAGTRFTVYGNKNVNPNQGYAEVIVTRDITSPVVIDTFEKTVGRSHYVVNRGGSSNQLDGKVSSIKVSVP